MLLSRAFCLILGTTLFVLIWTMQDGNHRPTRMARSGRSQFVGPQAHPSAKRSISQKTKFAPMAAPKTAPGQLPIILPTAVVTPQAIVKAPVNSLLWMFADEPQMADVTQIAIK